MTTVTATINIGAPVANDPDLPPEDFPPRVWRDFLRELHATRAIGAVGARSTTVLDGVEYRVAATSRLDGHTYDVMLTYNDAPENTMPDTPPVTAIGRLTARLVTMPVTRPGDEFGPYATVTVDGQYSATAPLDGSAATLTLDHVDLKVREDSADSRWCKIEHLPLDLARALRDALNAANLGDTE